MSFREGSSSFEGPEEGTEVTEALITSVEEASTSNLVGAIGSAADVAVRCPVSLIEVQNAIRQYGKAAERFEFQKASEIIMKFRQSNLSVTSTPQEVAWEKLLTALAMIAECDNRYYPLSFISAKKSMFRKDTGALKQAYMNIAERLKSGMDEIGSDSVSVHLLSQCREYVRARVKMIEFYEFMAILESMPIICWTELEEEAASLCNDLTACHHPDLSPISHLFQEEVDILRLLISAQICISQCKMFDSLLQLKEVRERFDFWIKEIGSLNERSIGFFARLKGAEPIPKNRLILWLIKFYDLLMAKFSLYFTNVLGKFCSEDDLKSIHMIDNKFNFIDTFEEFLRKTGALIVAIVMDRTDEHERDPNGFYGFGYNRRENRFTPGESIEPKKDYHATCPYVFKTEYVPLDHQQKTTSQAELLHGDIAEFIMMMRGIKDHKPPTTEQMKKEKIALPKWHHPELTRCVTGDLIEASLYMVVVYQQPTSPNKQEDKSEVSGTIRHMQHLLRGSRLFTELRTTAK